MRRVLAVIVAAVLVGCAGGAPDDSAPTTVAPAAQEDSATTARGVPDALGFSAPLVGGGELDARSLVGRPVVFWFWSPY